MKAIEARKIMTDTIAQRKEKELIKKTEDKEKTLKWIEEHKADVIKKNLDIIYEKIINAAKEEKHSTKVTINAFTNTVINEAIFPDMIAILKNNEYRINHDYQWCEFTVAEGARKQTCVLLKLDISWKY